MNIGIVTTFSDKGYQEYAHWFVESIKKYLSKDINIFFYTDNITFKTSKNESIQNLESSVPNLTKFKERNKDKKVTDFLFDAVRFSHKSYCLFHAAKTKKVDVLVWLDSDSELIAPITPQFISSFMEQGKFVSYLGRGGRYTETGFLVFDMNHKHAQEFFDRFIEYYDNDKIYDLSAQLDCHAFDAARIQMEKEGKIENKDISPAGVTKNHFDQALNGFVTHYKGTKKTVRDKHYSKAIKRQEKVFKKYGKIHSNRA